MRLRKLLTMLVVFSLLLTLLGGCAQEKTQTPDVSEPAEQSSPPAEAPPPPTEDDGTLAGTALIEDIPDKAGFSDGVEVDESLLSTVKISYPLQYGEDAEITFWTEFFSGFELYGLEDFNDLPMLPYIKEKTGINYVFICVSEAAKEEQFGLMLASGDWTDVFMVNDFYTGGLGQAYEDEVILDLTDLLPQHAPDYWNFVTSANQATRDAIMTDGMHLQMCSLRDAVYSDGGYMLRGDWLDELGITLGETVTKEEIDNILYSFHDTYGGSNTLYVLEDGGIPAPAAFNTVAFNIAAATSLPMYKVEDTVCCSFQTEEYRDYIEWFIELYDYGIINKDFYALDLSTNEMYEQTGNGNMGMWNGFADSINEGKKYTTDENWKAVPLPLAVNDEGMSHFGSDTAYANNKGFQVTTQCADPGMVLEFFNWFDTEEGYTFANYGIEGETYTVDENGIYHFTDLIANNPDVPNFMMAMQIYTFNKAPAMEIQSKLWGLYEQETIDAIKLWSIKDHVTSNCTIPTGAALNTEETNSIKNEVADIISYASEAIMKFMTGVTEMNDENWNDFVGTCNELGMEHAVSVYQNAYDEYRSGTRVIVQQDSRPGGGPPPGGDPGGGPPPDGEMIMH